MDKRELSEIALALFYKRALHHGTAGHNRLMLIANLAYDRRVLKKETDLLAIDLAIGDAVDAFVATLAEAGVSLGNQVESDG